MSWSSPLAWETGREALHAQPTAGSGGDAGHPHPGLTGPLLPPSVLPPPFQPGARSQGWHPGRARSQYPPQSLPSQAAPSLHQQLCQLAPRAGRRGEGGEPITQSWPPSPCRLHMNPGEPEVSEPGVGSWGQLLSAPLLVAPWLPSPGPGPTSRCSHGVAGWEGGGATGDPRTHHRKDRQAAR